MSCFLGSSVQEDPVPNHYCFQALQAFFQLTALTQMNTPHTSNTRVIPQPGASLLLCSYQLTPALHHATGQAIPSSSGSTYSLQKHLSSTAFFQPLQKYGVLQSWQNVRPCSVLKRVWLQTGLPPHTSCKNRLPKMRIPRNTAHQRSALVLSTVASEWLNSLWNVAGLQTPNLIQTNDFSLAQVKGSSSLLRFLLCLVRQTSRQKSPFQCLTSFCSYYPTTKTESLHAIQTIMAQLIQHLREKGHNEHLIDPRRCEFKAILRDWKPSKYIFHWQMPSILKINNWDF